MERCNRLCNIHVLLTGMRLYNSKENLLPVRSPSQHLDLCLCTKSRSSVVMAHSWEGGQLGGVGDVLLQQMG